MQLCSIKKAKQGIVNQFFKVKKETLLGLEPRTLPMFHSCKTADLDATNPEKPKISDFIVSRGISANWAIKYHKFHGLN